VCAKVVYRLRNMCVARCFEVWIEHAEGSRRMKQLCLIAFRFFRTKLFRKSFSIWSRFIFCKRFLFVRSFRVVCRLCAFSLRVHFRGWSSIVVNWKREQIESLVISLEDEFSRIRVVNEQHDRHRQHLELQVATLEQEVRRLRIHGHIISDEAMQLARLNQKYMQILAQYDGWQQEFEGFVMTDAAINRLRPHVQSLKLPPAVPPGMLPVFVSPLRNQIAEPSVARSGRAFTSPDRHNSSPSDAFLDSTLSASVGRVSQARRRGGGYDLDV
jgi:hypothetical protein